MSWNYRKMEEHFIWYRYVRTLFKMFNWKTWRKNDISTVAYILCYPYLRKMFTKSPLHKIHGDFKIKLRFRCKTVLVENHLFQHDAIIMGTLFGNGLCQNFNVNYWTNFLFLWCLKQGSPTSCLFRTRLWKWWASTRMKLHLWNWCVRTCEAIPPSQKDWALLY